MRRNVSTAAIVLALVSGVTAGQQPATGTIAGTVVDVSGQPLPGSTVRIADLKTSLEMSMPAPDGRFQFNNVAPGRYALSAVADGYVPMEYGAFQEGDPGVPVLAAARQKISGLIITLRKGGAISGRLIDDRGDPISGHVSILLASAPWMKTVTAGSTDNDGSYRFPDLPPGSYGVLAVPDPSPRERRAKDASGVDRVVALTPTFYPGATTLAGASLVTISGDDEASGTNIQVQAQTATTVELSLTNASGKVPRRAQAALIADADRGPARVQWAQDPDASGKAVIAGVIAGQYRLVVSASEPAGQEWAVRNLFVDGLTPAAMPVVLEAGAAIQSRATFEGEGRPGRAVALRLQIVEGDVPKPMERGPDVLMLAGTELTTIRGIAPGRYVLQVGEADGPSMLSLKAARINGADVLDLPVELRGGDSTAVSLVLTDRQSTVSGMVTDADGRPRLDVAVVVFPRDSRYWLRGSRRILATRPDTSGAYEFQGLPGGEYLLAAVAERPPDDVSDSQWLSRLTTSAVRLVVADGQRHVLDLKASR